MLKKLLKHEWKETWRIPALACALMIILTLVSVICFTRMSPPANADELNAGAFVLMICGFCPKLGAIFSTIPAPVLGGSIITVFSMILLNGIKMISRAGFSERNILVMGVTFALGLGLAADQAAVAHLPAILRFIFSDSVAATCIVAIIMNVLCPMKDKEDIEKAKQAMIDC